MNDRFFHWVRFCGKAFDKILWYCRILPLIQSYKEFCRQAELLKKNDIKFSKSVYTLNCDRRPLQVALRKDTTDFMVFEQVLITREYQPIIDLFRINGREVRTILDAGANIGLTSLQLAQHFPEAVVIALEPDSGNYQQLTRNLSLNPLARITPLNVGLWHESTTLKPDNSFRNGREWSRAFEASDPSVPGEAERGAGITAKTVDQICRENGISDIDFLKIDIEGAERFVFDAAISNLDFLSRVQVLALEIHDEFNVRSGICQVLRDRGFMLLDIGETTVAISKSFLSAPAVGREN